MRVFTCNHCSRIHLEIANTQIHFASVEQLEIYSEYLDSIDVEHYANINRKKGLTRVIILPLDNNNSVHLGFTIKEFDELKTVVRDYLSESWSAQVIRSFDEN